MIKVVFLDVDGVLTDGSITYDLLGREVKRFNVKDGYGITRAMSEGLDIVVVSGRFSLQVEKRCRELGIKNVYQGVSDKVAFAESFLKERSLSFDNAAAMGDDVPDLPLLKKVSVSGAPSDAVPEVKVMVDFVSRFRGGEGAVREFLDFLLKEKGNEE